MWDTILVGVLALIAGMALGFFIARKTMINYLKKNPPINEQMIRMMMMQMGMTPSTELLALAGLTPEQAAEYVKQFLPKSSGTGGNVPQSEPKTAPATEKTSEVATGGLSGLMGAAQEWFQNYYDPSKANQSGTVWDTIGKPLVQGINTTKNASDTAAKTNQDALPNYSAEQNSILKETLAETRREEVDETKYKGKDWRKNNGR